MEFQQNTRNGRILALDLGKKRIGLALSDPLGITAQGLDTLQRTTIREDIATLEALAHEHQVELVLLGHPLNMKGTEGRQAVYTRDFAERLRERTGLAVRFWDERLTSKEAERVLKQSGISIEKRAKAIDRLAAVILLASYLDAGGTAGEMGRRSGVKLLLALLCVLAGLAAWALLTPYRGFEKETYVEIARGSGTGGMARQLADAGVIRYPWQFWLTRLTQPSAKLQAGEYRFEKAASVREVFDRIARGDIYYFVFTVPEGSNIFDIGRSLEAQGVMKTEDFLAAAENPALIRDLAPKARTLEGYLFPSTYRLSHAITAPQLTKMMTDEFRKEWSKLSADKQTDVHQAVTLASLVEKETAAPEERPVIASVFSNRLTHGMRLECDPTTIYAALLEKRYRGAIHRSDLASANPYNTYQNAGLPPGPIASPGTQSLKAALEPAETSFLFFVAKPGGGGHQFSATMAQHEKAVIAYRNATRKKVR